MSEASNAAVTLGLGVLQGITEFLPIPSDGHLAAFALLFTVPEASLALTVLLHAGTLLATTLVFRRDLGQLARAAARQAADPASFANTAEGSLLRSIVVATIPTVIMGLFLQHQVEALSQARTVVGVGFLVSAAAVFSTRGRMGGGDRLTLGGALLVGLAQGLAVLPGVSRSALTIATGLALGLSAPQAFRFSFLLSLPAVAGAALLELGDPEVLLGFSQLAWLSALLSFVTGAAALLVLRTMLMRGRFWLFGVYLVPLGAAMLAWDWFGGR